MHSVRAAPVTEDSVASLNARALAEDERGERRQLVYLTMPALGIITGLVVLPCIWLFYESFRNESGFSLENYSRIVENSSYVAMISTTFVLAAVVSVLCMVLGYPLSYLMAKLPPSVSIVLLSLVLLPFWTPLLARTYAWTIILRRNGLVNEILTELGIVDQPVSLLYNLTGTIIGMTHIMVPFLVLPLYASMRSIDPHLVRAGAASGARPVYAFWTIYFPLSLPGLIAGTIIVFIYSLGFYVTPAILGGGKVSVIGMKIFQDVEIYETWGPAASLGLVLLIITLASLVVVIRLVDLGRWFGGR